MNSKELDNLVQAGLLKSEPGEQTEFDRLLDSGRKRLADAKVGNLSSESRFTLAYDAAHAFSLAALRWHGYRPDKKRFVVFQALQHTLGLKPEIWRVLDKCHQHRNLAEYEGYFEVDKQLLADLLATSDLIRKAVERLGSISKVSR
jgi:DNA-binding MarR family transcriptional regulator